MKVSGATDQGCKRKNNEDYYFLDLKRRLFIVADGMGGHQAGEKASRLAVETAEKLLSSTRISEIIDNEEKIKTTMIDAVSAANEAVFKASRSNRKLRGMGCTLIMAIARGNLFHICHVGDTRAYMISKDNIRVLTEDHTIVQDLINSGNLTYEESKKHPLKHMLSRSIGNKKNVEVAYRTTLVKFGSYLLLCSDGLNSMVEDKIIKEIVIKEEDIDDIRNNLIDTAKKAGGKDNVTVVVITPEEEDIFDLPEGYEEMQFPEEAEYKTTRLTLPSGKPWWNFWKLW